VKPLSSLKPLSIKIAKLGPMDPDDFELALAMVAEVLKKDDNAITLEHLTEVVGLMSKTSTSFLKGITDEDDFFTFDDIESLIQEHNRRMTDISFQNLIMGLRRVPAESAIVKKKKTNSKKKG
jgi:hypothetical protein